MQEFMSGILVGLALAAPVGPVGILCIRLALTQGRWPATAAGLGAATADAIFGAIAGLGLILIQTFIADNQSTLSFVGGLIVMTLGVVTLRTPAVLDSRHTSLVSLAKDFATTFSMAIVNPATMVAAFGLIAALDPLGANTTTFAGALFIGGVFAGSTLWWLCLASIAVSLRSRMVKNLAWINKVSGGLFLAFGGVLLAQVFLGAS